MANGGCCQLIGNLNLDLDRCIISVSTSSSAEAAAICGDEPLEGAVIHSVSLSGYASTELWKNCPGKAGVNIPYIRKYDCATNKIYFIFAGQGQSFVAGPVSGYASLYKSFSSVTSFSASASSGPAGIYMEVTQTNGYGLNYSGGPFSFSTSELGSTVDLGGFLGGQHYLQSFNFDAQPGQLPIASYTFVAAMGEGS
jgi:hypothetical protein